MPKEDSILRAVEYAMRVKVVTAWPDDIPDEAIRSARKAGYIKAFEHVRGVQMAQVVFGDTRIEDEPTDAGIAFVENSLLGESA